MESRLVIQLGRVIKGKRGGGGKAGKRGGRGSLEKGKRGRVNGTEEKSPRRRKHLLAALTCKAHQGSMATKGVKGGGMRKEKRKETQKKLTPPNNLRAREGGEKKGGIEKANRAGGVRNLCFHLAKSSLPRKESPPGKLQRSWQLKGEEGEGRKRSGTAGQKMRRKGGKISGKS